MKKLFFERMREKRGEVPQVFVYDEFPESVRKQIIMIVDRHDVINEVYYKKIVQSIREGIGEFKLADTGHDHFNAYSYEKELFQYFEGLSNVDHVLTVVELLGMVLALRHNGDYCINQINERLLMAGIGWKVTGECLVQIEDETFFNEVTSPCLSVLGNAGYKQAHKHFMDAYNELKQKHFDDALTDCGQALESIIKTRLASVGVEAVTDKNWSDLKNLLKKHMVIPSYMENYQNNLFEVVGGLPTARNKDGAHGKEEGVSGQLDEKFVRFAINQMAANILFIAEADFK